jgi:hypothetical protein
MKEKKRDIKRKRPPAPRYPHIISEDDSGRAVIKSRGCVSWEPNLQPS